MNENNLVFCPVCGWILKGSTKMKKCSVCHVDLRDTNIPNKDMPTRDIDKINEFNQKIYIEIIKPLGMLDESSEAFKEMYDLYFNYKNDEDCNLYITEPKCPTCGDTRIHKISTAAKGTNALFFGLLENKRKYQFQCLNPSCKYMW